MYKFLSLANNLQIGSFNYFIVLTVFQGRFLAKLPRFSSRPQSHNVALYKNIFLKQHNVIKFIKMCAGAWMFYVDNLVYWAGEFKYCTIIPETKTSMAIFKTRADVFITFIIRITKLGLYQYFFFILLNPFRALYWFYTLKTKRKWL